MIALPAFIFGYTRDQEIMYIDVLCNVALVGKSL